jgi:hypothetical protein
VSGAPSFDESIPVLTEVVQEHAPAAPVDAAAPDDLPVLAPEDAIAAPLVQAAPVAQVEPLMEVEPVAQAEPAGRAGAPGDDAWRALEERLVARVLDRLHERVDLVLEHQVRTGMAPVLDAVVASLAADLREGLQQTVEQVVVRAVAQELAHLKSRTS